MCVWGGGEGVSFRSAGGQDVSNGILPSVSYFSLAGKKKKDR